MLLLHFVTYSVIKLVLCDTEGYSSFCFVYSIILRMYTNTNFDYQKLTRKCATCPSDYYMSY